MKKPKIPKLPKSLSPLRPRPFKRRKPAEERVSDALSSVPRITNETVAEHREEVIGSARKYIYPLRHSKHSVVRTSIGLLLLVLIVFFIYCGLSLYKFQNTSGFMYGVSQVVPFPVAKVGHSWVSYESYLFELRRNIHYYANQQKVNFSTADGKAQLIRLRQQAMSQVIQDALVKQLAAAHQVSVGDRTVSDEVTLVRSQNRLGSSDQVFKEVLSEFWGWNEDDFKRELKQQLLQQAVVAKLDTATDTRAMDTIKQLEGGADFSTLAGQVSDDFATKANGGQYQSAITTNDSAVPPAITQALFTLKPGQTSSIINTGYTLDIVKVITHSSNSVQAAHIQFTFQPIKIYTSPLLAKERPHKYIKV